MVFGDALKHFLIDVNNGQICRIRFVLINQYQVHQLTLRGEFVFHAGPKGDLVMAVTVCQQAFWPISRLNRTWHAPLDSHVIAGKPCAQSSQQGCDLYCSLCQHTAEGRDLTRCTAGNCSSVLAKQLGSTE